MRIVSLLPSATEILAALGLEDQLVGITHGCDHPESVADRPRVTRSFLPPGIGSGEVDRLVRERYRAGLPLYELDEPLLARLHPDLLLTQGLCDVCAIRDEDARRVAGRLPGSPKVVSFAPRSLEDVYADILSIGELTGTGARAANLVGGLRQRIAAVQERVRGLPRTRVSVLEWLDPLYAAGHWTPELVALAGGAEGHGAPGGRSRVLEWAQVESFRPGLILVACCGLTVAESLVELERARLFERLDSPAFVGTRLVVTDGQGYFSRSSPRLVDSVELLGHLLHPDRCPPPGVPWTEVEVSSRH